MNISDAILNRRAIKHYDPNYHVSEEEIQKLLFLAMQSPTAFNIQHWRFVLVRDPEIRKQIRAVAWDQAQITDASLLIVLCAKLSAWEEPQRYWKNAPQAVQNFIIPSVLEYYQGKPQVIRDEAMRSCGLAGQTIMLAAQEMGLDSCPMDGFDFEAVGKMINLPEDHLISFMIAVGKKTSDAWPKPGQIEYKEAVIVDRFLPIQGTSPVEVKS
ncbi:MAG: nitroreductase family protein [Chthoniobacterales bacterium]